jgi:hypothetical protein
VVEWDSGKVIGNNHGVLHCSMESFRLITTRAGHACRSHPFLVIACVVESIFRYEDPVIPSKCAVFQVSRDISGVWFLFS